MVGVVVYGFSQGRVGGNDLGRASRTNMHKGEGSEWSGSALDAVHTPKPNVWECVEKGGKLEMGDSTVTK